MPDTKLVQLSSFVDGPLHFAMVEKFKALPFEKIVVEEQMRLYQKLKFAIPNHTFFCHGCQYSIPLLLRRFPTAVIWWTRLL